MTKPELPGSIGRWSMAARLTLMNIDLPWHFDLRLGQELIAIDRAMK